LNQNNAKQQVCKAKAQKGVDWALELKSQKQQKWGAMQHARVSKKQWIHRK